MTENTGKYLTVVVRELHSQFEQDREKYREVINGYSYDESTIKRFDATNGQFVIQFTDDTLRGWSLTHVESWHANFPSEFDAEPVF